MLRRGEQEQCMKKTGNPMAIQETAGALAMGRYHRIKEGKMYSSEHVQKMRDDIWREIKTRLEHADTQWDEFVQNEAFHIIDVDQGEKLLQEFRDTNNPFATIMCHMKSLIPKLIDLEIREEHTAIARRMLLGEDP